MASSMLETYMIAQAVVLIVTCAATRPRVQLNLKRIKNVVKKRDRVKKKKM